MTERIVGELVGGDTDQQTPIVRRHETRRDDEARSARGRCIDERRRRLADDHIAAVAPGGLGQVAKDLGHFRRCRREPLT